MDVRLSSFIAKNHFIVMVFRDNIISDTSEPEEARFFYRTSLVVANSTVITALSAIIGSLLIVLPLLLVLAGTGFDKMMEVALGGHHGAYLKSDGHKNKNWYNIFEWPDFGTKRKNKNGKRRKGIKANQTDEDIMFQSKWILCKS